MNLFQTKYKYLLTGLFACNKEYISLNYTFDIVPKDKNVTYYNLKVDATLDPEVIAMHLTSFENGECHFTR